MTIDGITPPAGEQIAATSEATSSTHVAAPALRVVSADLDDLRFQVDRNAACSGVDGDIFYSQIADDGEVARGYCVGCPVRWECLLVNIAEGNDVETKVITGGLLPPAKQRIVQRLKGRVPTVTDLRRLVIDTEPLSMEAPAEWQIEHSNRRILNRDRAEADMLPTLSNVARVARIVVDRWRGERVSEYEILQHLKTRDDIGRGKPVSAIKKALKENLVEGSFRQPAMGHVFIEEDAQYAPFEY